jgi:hypothetical protein
MTSCCFVFLKAMLSAVIQRLHDIRGETTWERKLAIIDVCSSAYPDVRPWQVKRECVSLASEAPNLSDGQREELNDLYYTYLSLLLHPMDGHATARHDRALVQVWSQLRSLRPFHFLFSHFAICPYFRNGANYPFAFPELLAVVTK